MLRSYTGPPPKEDDTPSFASSLSHPAAKRLSLGCTPSPAAAGKWGGATKKLRLRPQLTPENVSALLGVLPTSEESDLVRSHAAELKAKGITSGPIGRVERFFLCLDEIYAPEQRLCATATRTGGRAMERQ